MRKCKKCGSRIPCKIEVDGKVRNLQRRTFCLRCSPFGSHNTTDLSQPVSEKQRNEKYRRWQIKARLQRKQRLVDLLGGKCEECGYNRCLRSLTFHHRDPKQKKFEVCENLLRKWMIVLKEAMKCRLLCANCHGEVHDREYGNVADGGLSVCLKSRRCRFDSDRSHIKGGGNDYEDEQNPEIVWSRL